MSRLGVEKDVSASIAEYHLCNSIAGKTLCLLFYIFGMRNFVGFGGKNEWKNLWIIDVLRMIMRLKKV